jgi:glycerol dehydrogenase
MLRTIGFPGQYTQGPGALDALGEQLARAGFARAVVLCDAAVGESLWPRVDASLRRAGLDAHRAMFPGECTKGAIADLANRVRAFAPDVVVGLGGGKAIDCAKGVAMALGTQVAVCPTIASNDAPTSRLIVLYDDDHRVVGVDYLSRNPVLVLVDTDVIVRAPVRFFAAGIGDAISKRFEAAQCFASGGHNSFGTPPLDTALRLTNMVYDVLMSDGRAACAAVAAGRLDATVERVVEATVLLSGVGFESGGLSLAHALIRGLTAIPSISSMLHGELVAFGTLVQMEVEGRNDQDIEALIELLVAVALPVTLRELGQRDALTQAERDTIVDATLAAAYSRHMTPPLTAGRLARALHDADRRGEAALRRRAATTIAPATAPGLV